MTISSLDVEYVACEVRNFIESMLREEDIEVKVEGSKIIIELDA